MPWFPPSTPPLAFSLTISPSHGSPLVVPRLSQSLDLPLPSIAVNRSQRCSPISAAAGGSSPPSFLVVPETTTSPLPSDFLPEGKQVPEEGRYWPWDPGICKAGGVRTPCPPADLIHDGVSKSSFCLCGRRQQGDVRWYIARDDGSFDKSGHRGLKNLKDAKSSISSSPSNVPKQSDRICNF